MSDCYESMSLTTIRDRPLRQHLIRHSRYPFVVPAHRFVILAEAGIQRGGVAPMTPKHLQRPALIFILSCAGTSRHERLVRKWPAREIPLTGACPQLGRPRQPPGPTFPVLRRVRNCSHNVIIMKHMFSISRLRRGANVDSYRQPQLGHGTRTRQDMKNAKQMLLQTRTWPDDQP